MKRLIPCTLLFCIWSLPQLATAFIGNQSQIFDPSHINIAPLPVYQKVIRPDLQEPVLNDGEIIMSGDVSIKHDIISNAPRLITKLKVEKSLSKINRNSLVQQALQFVVDNKEVLGLNTENLVLNEESVLIADDLQTLTFNITESGHTVDDASIIFRFKYGMLSQIVNESFGEAASATIAFYDEAQLKEFASSALLSSSISKTRDLIRVTQDESGYRKLAVVEFEAVVGEMPYYIQIETLTGNIFEVRQKYWMSQGEAKATLYPRWYNETLEWMPLKELQVKKGDYTDDAGLFSDGADTSIALQGRRVRVMDKEKHGIILEQKGRSDGSIELIYDKSILTSTAKDAHDDRTTAQAMTYYHVTKIAKLAEKYIPQTKWLQASLTANVNVPGGTAGGCNAFWDGSSVNFYVGGTDCANTGMIADVVYHEWGHGLDANTGGIKDGAFSEGFGDIVAMLITQSPEVGKGFMYPSYKPVRNLATLVTTAGAGWASDPHQEGLIIGGTFWSLYEMLADKYGMNQGIEIMRNYAFKVIYTADKYKQVYDALLVLDDDDGDLTNGTPNQCLINKAFTEHRLATALPNCT